VTDRLQRLLDEAAAGGVFPCARAVVLRSGTCVFEGGVGRPTIFDLASLTKVMCTAAVFLALWRDEAVEPEMPVARAFPDSAVGRAEASVADLLYHRAGLPAFVPLFAAVLRAEPRLAQRDCPPAVRTGARRLVVDAALAAPLEAPRGTRPLYGDVGFIVLGELLALAAGIPLDALYDERVAAPLALTARFRRLSRGGADAADRDAVAPTGPTRPREPAPGQEGSWGDLTPVPSPPGEVDDDNAWAMDGVAGHAGLFGTAADVARFGQAVLDDLEGAGRIAPARLWALALRRDPVTPGSTRALGFDTRLPDDPPGASSAGRALGQVPPGAVGHLGFTGTSLWVDRAHRVVVALLTNRTALGRAETRIREFRPRFHDAVMETLGLAA
jgi:CubicO group peptidase (beta-lactamase class C family)